MATGATPLFGTLTWLDTRQTDRDPASHGVELALELRIADPAGGPTAAAVQRTGALARAWAWVHLLPFVGHHRH